MLICDWLLDYVIPGFFDSNLTLESNGFELASTITLVLQVDWLTKCASHPSSGMNMLLPDSKPCFQLAITIQIWSLVSNIEVSFPEYKLRFWNPTSVPTCYYNFNWKRHFRIIVSFLEWNIFYKILLLEILLHDFCNFWTFYIVSSLVILIYNIKTATYYCWGDIYLGILRANSLTNNQC